VTCYAVCDAITRLAHNTIRIEAIVAGCAFPVTLTQYTIWYFRAWDTFHKFNIPAIKTATTIAHVIHQEHTMGDETITLSMEQLIAVKTGRAPVPVCRADITQQVLATHTHPIHRGISSMTFHTLINEAGHGFTVLEFAVHVQGMVWFTLIAVGVVIQSTDIALV